MDISREIQTPKYSVQNPDNSLADLGLPDQPKTKRVFRNRAADPAPMAGAEATLITDDCLAALKRMATGSVPVFFFSPPYNKHRNGNHPGSPGDQRGNITNRISFEAYSASKGGETLGRFPANVIHDGSDAVLEAFPHTKTGKGKKNAKGGFSGGWGERGDDLSLNGGDEGSAARYFYCAKPSKAEKGDTSHVTVKPVALMRYLVKLVTPAGGLVLDPFGGSGTTGVAAAEDGFRCILMECDPEYAEDIRRRVAHFNDSIAA